MSGPLPNATPRGGLMLGRRIGEGLEVDGPAKVYVHRIRNNQVVLRVQGAEVSRIHRFSEVVDANKIEG